MSLITDTERETSSLARNTFYNLLGYGIPLLIGVFTIPFLIRLLGTERFGILALIWIVFGYFNVFNLGLSRATTKFAAELRGRGENHKIADYFWTTIISQGVIGIGGMIIVMVVTTYLVENILKIPAYLLGEAKFSFLIIALSLPVVIMSASCRGLIEAFQRFDLVNLVKIPSSTANYVLPLVGALLGWDLVGIVLVIAMARLLTFGAWAALCFRILPQLREKILFKREILKTLFIFGGWVTVSYIITPFLNYIDRFFLGSLVDIQAVSYYTVPFELVSKLGIIPASLVLTLFPSFSALHGIQAWERIREMFLNSIKYLTFVLGGAVILLIFLAPFILKIWIGQDFPQKSTGPLQVLTIGIFLNALALVPLSHLQGTGRVDIPGKIYLIELLFYLPLSYFLIKYYGLLGASWAWTIRSTIEALGLLYFSAREGKVRIAELRKTKLAMIFFSLIIILIGGKLIDLANQSFYWGIIAVILYYGGNAWFSFSSQERRWLWSQLLTYRRESA